VNSGQRGDKTWMLIVLAVLVVGVLMFFFGPTIVGG
jgi:uncharacterized membrane protein